MVHGTTYTVRYVIKLKKEIDYYDILLPICSANRKMFELIYQNEDHEQPLLVVFGEKDLNERFKLKTNTEKYYKVLSHMEYSGAKTDDEINYESTNIKYWQAFMYSLNLKIFVKNNFIPYKIYSDKEIIKLNEK